MDLSQPGTTSSQNEVSLSGWLGSLLGTLSMVLLGFSMLSSWRALSMADVLYHMPEQERVSRFTSTPGFNHEAFDAMELIGEVTVVLGTILLVIALVTVSLSWRRARLTKGHAQRLLTAWGVSCVTISFLLLAVSLNWLWQAHLVHRL
ncbi:hypothetical protein [Ktedonobacter racemifer]|uniref:Uncharacterized protein n=1 Tax=Ktedonobacter racemifer DSM 44963 TaxID=485913 RepID=D6U898_KTERA|nr:hypothetical protein [Ktedonobacter racemifer]EFH80109.1 hypothetical protein Krac_0662 [Ktedonobacter racemifer DSM 44963]